MGRHIIASSRLSVPMRALGKTGLVLPVLGFGVSGVLASPTMSDDSVHTLVQSALELGVRVFDTAPFYGRGLAEKRLAAGLEGFVGGSPFIMTKVGTYRENGRWKKDFSIEGITRQVDESLNRLSRIDALFLHGPAPETLTPDLINALENLRVKGKFRFLGLAGRERELDSAIASQHFDLIMAPVHKDLPSHALDRLENARASNIGIIGIEAMSPAMGGVRLSLKPSDVWHSLRAVSKHQFYLADKSAAENCLGWTLRSGLVDVVLVSTTRLNHLYSNASICAEKLENF